MKETDKLENEFVMVVGNSDSKRKCVFQVVQDQLNLRLLHEYNELAPHAGYRMANAKGDIVFCVLQIMGQLMIDFHESPYAEGVDSSDETILRLAKSGFLFGDDLALDGSCGINIAYLGPFTNGDPGFESEEVAQRKGLIEQVKRAQQLLKIPGFNSTVH